MTLRLKTLATFINPEDIVCDIGCDHAYLPIYLIKRGICNQVWATEINKNAYNFAKENIKNEHLEDKITLILSDGISDLEEEVNTLVIAGMGTSSILHIVRKAKNKKITKLIIQTNNDLPLLRKEMQKLGFYLHTEKVILDKDVYYTIGVYKLEKRKLNNLIYNFGIKDSLNQTYYLKTFINLRELEQKIPMKDFKKKLKVLYQIHLIKKYL